MYLLLKADRALDEFGIRAGDVIKVIAGQRPTLHRRLDMGLADVCRARDRGALVPVESPHARQASARSIGSRVRARIRGHLSLVTNGLPPKKG